MDGPLGISPSLVDLSLQEIILLSKSVSRHANECVFVVLCMAYAVHSKEANKWPFFKAEKS